jgi:hypothetical protein
MKKVILTLMHKMIMPSPSVSNDFYKNYFFLFIYWRVNYIFKRFNNFSHMYNQWTNTFRHFYGFLFFAVT